MLIPTGHDSAIWNYGSLESATLAILPWLSVTNASMGIRMRRFILKIFRVWILIMGGNRQFRIMMRIQIEKNMGIRIYVKLYTFLSADFFPSWFFLNFLYFGGPKCRCAISYKDMRIQIDKIKESDFRQNWILFSLQTFSLVGYFCTFHNWSL